MRPARVIPVGGGRLGGLRGMLRRRALSGLVAVVLRLAQLALAGIGVGASAILVQGAHGIALVVMGDPSVTRPPIAGREAGAAKRFRPRLATGSTRAARRARPG